MRCFLIAITSLMFVGCGDRNLLDVMAGHKYEVVILAQNPVLLNTTPIILRGDRPMHVIGEQAMVCLVLRGDVASQDSDSDALFKQSMNDTKVDVSVKLKSAKTIQLDEPMPAWRLSGRILKSGEFSACASACCQDKQNFSKGSEIAEVRIVSSKALKVQGIFWESNNAFDDIGKKP